ncbi:hybrid sensor histidine kinase/response regulator transcription factor [Phocaeicola plebeius]|uniref:hybrid sensor histidine kinase/response regulator transcription factor n=1 Tax=Phocaeicola plebeius TaxID=310297 RepID=UPI0022DF657F|nr:hybrid sensor histidine kinase/response regulator transcription factor [Phocaeicola plebeius]
MKRLVLAVICIFLCLGIQAVNTFPFRHIGIRDGLPDNYVKNVFGIPDGRLGVRTTSLLSFYDGKNFTNYPLWKAPVYGIDQESVIPLQYLDADGRIWLKEKGNLKIFDLDKGEFIQPDTLLAGWGVKEKISNVFIDSSLHVWLVTASQRVLLYDTKNHQLQTIGEDRHFLNGNGTLMAVESYGNVSWMLHESGLLRAYDRNQKKFIRQETFLLNRLKSDQQVLIRMLDSGDFWIAWNEGAGFYMCATHEWKEVDLQSSEYICINSCDVDLSGNLFIGTTGHGVYFIDKYNFSVMSSDPLGNSLKRPNLTNVHSVYVDKKSGTFWVGLFNQGLAYFHPSMNNFILYDSNRLKGNWANEDVLCMLEMEDASLLLGTDQGLYQLSSDRKSVSCPYKELSTQSFRVAFRDRKGRIWLGTYPEGLYCINQGKLFHYKFPARKGMEVNAIRAIVEDEQENLWVSVVGGVGLFDPHTGELKLLRDRYPELAQFRIANALILEPSGRLVVGADNGIYFYDIKKDSLYIPGHIKGNDPFQILAGEKYNCMLNDSRGLLWMGTQYGIKVLSPDWKIDVLGEEHGFENLTIQGMQEDYNNEVWIATINALYKVSVAKEDGQNEYTVVCLDRNHSREWDDLYEFCSMRTRKGEICFGRMDGFYLFSPENVVFTPCAISPLFTGFRLFNESVSCGEEYHGRVLFTQSIDKVRSVTLNYDENFLTFDFSSLNFVNPSQTYFRYRLEGADKKWNEITSNKGQGSVVYNNLLPGEYTFRVMSAGNDHVWSPESVFHVSIRPPFWTTAWAFVLYFLCLIGAAILGVRYMYRKNNQKLIRLKEQQAAKQKEELNQLKFRFFTNISHELRTPLTLILTPLEVLRKKVTDEQVLRQLDMVYKNAQELYTLVNQLLDFRKMEMRMEKLHLTAGDLEEFISTLYANFQPFAKEKKLDFRLALSSAHWYMNFDHEKLHRILNNLLSNAFKFTPEGGTVTLSLSEEHIEGRLFANITVADTGIGMSAEALEHIFERFYQVQHADDSKVGSGIGLHLVKEYVQLHEGSIQVESQFGKGAVFIVRIPMDLKISEEASPAPIPLDNRKKLLIVEDNQDFRHFLKEQLSETYQVIDAPDGEEGEKLAIEQNPDLIISDIMMPKIDGLELCRRVKHNVQTSHIPVILLTARSGDEAKISGYAVGADSYISKPFSFDVLLVRIKQLIEQQEGRKKEFRKTLRVNPSRITITSIDEQLIQKALKLIEEHIDNSEYNVEQLSADMGMSRMNLYRKLQAITGQTPTEFIRTIRLKRAAQLLQDGKLNVSEVADRVGFSSSSYFTKCFKEQFGVLPTQYSETDESGKTDEK